MFDRFNCIAMRNIFLVSFVCVMAFFSCAENSNEEEVVIYKLAAPEDYKYLDENIKVSYEIITLDNSKEESLLPDISELHVHSNKLYIRAAGGVYIFDDKGGYIAKLEQGRGPGEFIGASDLFINKNGELEVLSRTDIYKFTLNGDFIGKIELPKRMFVEFAEFGNKYLLSTPRITKKTTHFFYVYDPQTQEEIPLIQGVERPLSEFNFNLFSDEYGSYYFTTLYSGLYYRLNEDLHIEKKFRFEPSISDDKLKTSISEDAIDNLSSNCYCVFYACRDINKKYFLLKASYGNHVRDIIYDRINGITFYNVFEGFLSAIFIGADSEWLYYSISPGAIDKMAEKEFINDVGKNLVNDLCKIIENDSQREGNPIIIKVKYE